MYDSWKTRAPEYDDAPEYGEDEPVEASAPDSDGMYAEALRLELADAAFEPTAEEERSYRKFCALGRA